MQYKPVFIILTPMKRACFYGILWLLAFSAFADFSLANMWDGDVHEKIVVEDTYYWSDIYISDGKKVVYTVEVVVGDDINVYLINNFQLQNALNGEKVLQEKSDEDTRRVEKQQTDTGTYALVITTNGPGNSTCKVDIVLRNLEFYENQCLMGILIAAILLPIGIAAAVIKKMRAKAGTGQAAVPSKVLPQMALPSPNTDRNQSHPSCDNRPLPTAITRSGCPGCGASVPPDLIACPNCGNLLRY
jgi:hypothetical protein